MPVGFTHDTGVLYGGYIVKVIVGSNLIQNAVGDSTRYATRPAWTIQPSTRRRNVTEGYLDLSGRCSMVHALLKH